MNVWDEHALNEVRQRLRDELGWGAPQLLAGQGLALGYPPAGGVSGLIADGAASAGKAGELLGLDGPGGGLAVPRGSPLDDTLGDLGSLAAKIAAFAAGLWLLGKLAEGFGKGVAAR